MSSKIQIPKSCEYCGKAFIARTTVTKCCSDYCSKRAYKERKRQEKINATLESEISNKALNQISIQTPDTLVNKDFLSVTEASQLIGVSRWSIQRMIKRGQLKAITFGRKHIIKRTQIEKLFN